MRSGEGWSWIRYVALHGAVMNGHVDTTVAFLVDDIGVQLDVIDEIGNTALHHAIIWGRTECIVYLLSRGARNDILNFKGESPLSLALSRQDKLQTRGHYGAQKNVSALELQKLIEEGTELVQILGGIEEAGSFEAWARQHAQHCFVFKHCPWIFAAVQRSDIMLLRTLLSRGRAELRGEDEIFNLFQSRGRSREKKEIFVPKISLADAMKRHSVQDLATSLRLLDVHELSDLRLVDREMVGKVEDLSAKDRRRLWLFVKEMKSQLPSLHLTTRRPKTRREREMEQREAERATRLEQELERKRQSGLRRFREGLHTAFGASMPRDAFMQILEFLYFSERPRKLA